MVFLSISMGKLNARIEDTRDILDVILARLDTFQVLVEKGEDNGYTPLDGDGIVPEEHLPPDLLEAAIYRGCWNAAINFPVITSSSGKDGEFFIVCTPGSTTINAESEWNLYDIIIFDVGLVKWIRIDGGRNVIANTAALGSNEASVIDDGTGPFFKLLKIAGGFGVNVTSDGESVLITADPAELEIKQIVAGDGIIITEVDASTLEIASDVGMANVGVAPGVENQDFGRTAQSIVNPGTGDSFDVKSIFGTKGVWVYNKGDQIGIQLRLTWRSTTLNINYTDALSPSPTSDTHVKPNHEGEDFTPERINYHEVFQACAARTDYAIRCGCFVTFSNTESGSRDYRTTVLAETTQQGNEFLESPPNSGQFPSYPPSAFCRCEHAMIAGLVDDEGQGLGDQWTIMKFRVSALCAEGSGP
jgi:hypothetical protein